VLASYYVRNREVLCGGVEGCDEENFDKYHKGEVGATTGGSKAKVTRKPGKASSSGGLCWSIQTQCPLWTDNKHSMVMLSLPPFLLRFNGTQPQQSFSCTVIRTHAGVSL
jgi:hypothetical protein